MKRLSIVIAVAALLSLSIAVPLFAAENGYGAAGCGLGSLLFGTEPGPIQIFAATTNGTSGNQTFGITSGTSNCNKQPKSFSSTKAHAFVAANMDSLAKDIAVGRGESLDTLAELLEIPAAQRPQTYAKLQSNFSNIFTSEKVEAADVIDSIVTIVRG